MKKKETLQEINLSEGEQMNESFLKMFAGGVEMLLKYMFGGKKPKVSIKGSDKELRTFASALGNEKKYLDAIRKYGLDDPKTYQHKHKLQGAISKFERTTGIKWPIT